MTQVKIPSWNQAFVEQHTGLSREVLRKWEQRYGYPQPSRGDRGQRFYTSAEVDKLKLISRLLSTGVRPAALMPLSQTALQTLLDQTTPGAPRAIDTDTLSKATQTLLDSLAPGQPPQAVQQFLAAQLTQHGLATMVAHAMPAFNTAVGEAWLAGRLSVAAEHRFTACLRQLVLRALPTPHHTPTGPRVLFTTPPGELHSLGLLALHAQLSLHGADCHDLDTQTPAHEVVQAVRELRVGVLAISLSACMPSQAARAYLHEVQVGAGKLCTLWVGGQGCHALSREDLFGFEVFDTTTAAVQAWLALAKANRASA